MTPLSYHSSNLSLFALKTMRLLVQLNHGKKCEVLGSLLDTDKGSSRRKFLVTASIKNLKYIFCNRKLSIAVKTRVFNC